MTKTILILAANPKNTLRLRLDQEVREIDNGLQRARRRNEFILKQIWAVRRSDFRRAMLDLKPNIVHFCGHGSGEDGIAFEDENGQAKLIGTEALSGFFKLFADNVECVVLNACYSEVQAEAIAKHIPHVIGMNQAIGDTAAIEFSVAFYDALGAGESIKFAYQLACNAIQLSGIPENLTPILKSMGRPPKPVTQKEKPQLNFTSSTRLRQQVFVSYSRRDAEWLERLQRYLKPLENAGIINRWDDTKIAPGMKWRDEITQALARTRVAVLLVSEAFLASDFITSDELPALLKTAEQDGALIIPIIVSPCRYERTPVLNEFEPANHPLRTLEEMEPAEWKRVLLRVSQLIEDTLTTPERINDQNIVTGDFLSLDLYVVNPEKYGFQSPQYAIYANDQFESIGLLFAVSVAVYNPNSVDMLIVKWTLKVPDLGILVDRLSKRSTIKIFPSGIIRIRASSDLVLRIPAREMVDGILLRFEHICPIIKEKFGLGFDPINVELTAYLMNNYRKAICNCKLLPLDYLNWSKNNE